MISSDDDGLAAPFRLFRHDCLSSTNDLAKELAKDGAESWTVIWAKSQKGGRGRLGREWDSPEGNLYCSIVIDVKGRLERAAQISFIAAISLYDALKDVAPQVDFALKWPNDLLSDGAKICGILLEREGDSLILGVGVNMESAPKTTLYLASSLADRGVRVEILTLLQRFCQRLFEWERIWREQGFSPIREKWLSHAMGIDGPVKVRLANGQILPGRFYGLDAEGALLLDTAEGIRKILAGDVFFSNE